MDPENAPVKTYLSVLEMVEDLFVDDPDFIEDVRLRLNDINRLQEQIRELKAKDWIEYGF